MTRNRWIYHHVTLAEAALYAKAIGRDSNLAAYWRQELYSVINRSLGGDYMPDKSLLPKTPKARVTLTKAQKAKSWIRMASIFGVPVPPALETLSREGE